MSTLLKKQSPEDVNNSKNSSFIKSKSFYVTIVILILVITLFVKFFVPIGITVLEADGKGTYVDQCDDYTVMIGTDGNAYIRTEHFTDVPGTDKPEQYKKLFPLLFENIFAGSYFIQIYDGGDAEKIHMSYSSGTIITKSGDLYIFSGQFEKYTTPTLFEHNVKDAYMQGDTVFVINGSDELGYYKVSDENHFVSVCKNVRSFRVDEVSQTDMLVLTDDNILYIYSKSNNEYEKVKLCENIQSFSLTQGNRNGFDSNFLGVIDTDSNASYARCDGFSTSSRHHTEILKFADFQESYFVPTPIKAKDIARYEDGVALLCDNGDLYVIGYDLPGEKERFINDELVARDIKMISSDFDHVLTLDNDGILTCYGKNPDQSNIWFVPLSEDDK